MDRGGWATVHGVTKESDLTDRLAHTGRTGGEKWVDERDLQFLGEGELVKGIGKQLGH